LEDIRAEKFAKRSAYLLAQQQHHQEYSGFMADDEQQSFSDKQCPSAIVKHALLSPRKSSFVLTRRRLTYKQQKLDISESEMVAAKLRQGIIGKSCARRSSIWR
jgi:hypothetical protein